MKHALKASGYNSARHFCKFTWRPSFVGRRPQRRGFRALLATCSNEACRSAGLGSLCGSLTESRRYGLSFLQYVAADQWPWSLGNGDVPVFVLPMYILQTCICYMTCTCIQVCICHVYIYTHTYMFMYICHTQQDVFTLRVYAIPTPQRSFLLRS